MKSYFLSRQLTSCVTWTATWMTAWMTTGSRTGSSIGSIWVIITLLPIAFASAETPLTQTLPTQVMQTLPSQAEQAVNINAASPALLASALTGIGPSKAEAIVQYREQHGAFETIDALVNVKGIGPKTLDKIRSQLVAGPFTQPAKGESLAEKESVARAAVQAIIKRSNELAEQALSHK